MPVTDGHVTDGSRGHLVRIDRQGWAARAAEVDGDADLVKGRPLALAPDATVYARVVDEDLRRPFVASCSLRAGEGAALGYGCPGALAAYVDACKDEHDSRVHHDAHQEDRVQPEREHHVEQILRRRHDGGWDGGQLQLTLRGALSHLPAKTIEMLASTVHVYSA